MLFVKSGRVSCALLAVFKGLPRARVAKNKTAGAQFEKLFVHRAALGGLLALKNELSFRYQAGGKMLPIRTDLDFRLFNKKGQVAYLDCKSFTGEHFTYSQIDRHQLDRARIYESFNVPAGFVVWLQGPQVVVYYPARVLIAGGARSRFTVDDGAVLGEPMTFDLRLVFVATPWVG